MDWFGKRHGAAYESDSDPVAVPTRWACTHCMEPIAPDDDGFVMPTADGCRVVYHYECHVRLVVGGINHQLKLCTCCGGTEPPDPPGMTTREAARAATVLWHDMQRRGTRPLASQRDSERQDA